MKALLLLVALNASADEIWQPRTDAKSLYEQIKATGSDVLVLCPGYTDECKVVWTPAPGAVISVVDKRPARAAIIAELQDLDAKLDSPMTAEEIRRTIRLILKLMGQSERP